MSLINHEELKKQLASGEITSLDDITVEFKNILKEVIQTASQEELTSHLGYDKHQESNTSNARNGYSDKTIKSKYSQFDVSIPRDRDSSFQPQLIKKREILLDGSEDLILSLYTKGMSVRDIQLHLDDLYGYELSTQTISNITEKVIEKANEIALENWITTEKCFDFVEKNTGQTHRSAPTKNVGVNLCVHPDLSFVHNNSLFVHNNSLFVHNDSLFCKFPLSGQTHRSAPTFSSHTISIIQWKWLGIRHQAKISP